MLKYWLSRSGLGAEQVPPGARLSRSRTRAHGHITDSIGSAINLQLSSRAEVTTATAMHTMQASPTPAAPCTLSHTTTNSPFMRRTPNHQLPNQSPNLLSEPTTQPADPPSLAHQQQTPPSLQSANVLTDKLAYQLDVTTADFNNLQQRYDELNTLYKQVHHDSDKERKNMQEEKKKLANKEKALKFRENSITAREANQSERDESLVLLKTHVNELEQKIIILEDTCNNYKLKLLASEDLRMQAPKVSN